MTLAYYIVSTILTMMLSFIWKASDVVNLMLKMVFTVWFFWSVVMVLVTLFPALAENRVWG